MVDEEYERVCNPVNVLAVYVFGIVEDEWMYELTFESE